MCTSGPCRPRSAASRVHAHSRPRRAAIHARRGRTVEPGGSLFCRAPSAASRRPARGRHRSRARSAGRAPRPPPRAAPRCLGARPHGSISACHCIGAREEITDDCQRSPGAAIAEASPGASCANMLRGGWPPPGGGAELGGLGDDGSRLGARLQPDPRDAEGLRGPQSLIVRRSHLRAPRVMCMCVLHWQLNPHRTRRAA